MVLERSVPCAKLQYSFGIWCDAEIHIFCDFCVGAFRFTVLQHNESCLLYGADPGYKWEFGAARNEKLVTEFSTWFCVGGWTGSMWA